MNIDSLLIKNVLPDFLIRLGIRRLLKQRLHDEANVNVEKEQEHFMELVATLRESKLAVNTNEANEQHYEVPTSFFRHVLGKNLKYSCGYWKETTTTLDEAEDNMLALTCLRAGIKDGEDILELGCGWGSLTLYMAKHYPGCKISAVSNSKSQKEYIMAEAEKRNLSNITIITADMNEFTIDKKFDRVVSVEMFEHMRNYSQLFARVHDFLKPEGELFVHIFAHHKYAYLFEVKDASDWMSKYFFSGGIMPSNHLFFYFSEKFKVLNHWAVNGQHYEKTANAWLNNMDKNGKQIMQIFMDVYGEKESLKWYVYWRVFFMSCAELWGYNNGNEWFVSHYLLKRN